MGQSKYPSLSSTSGNLSTYCTLASKNSIQSLLPKYLLFSLLARYLATQASINIAEPSPEGHFQLDLSVR